MIFFIILLALLFLIFCFMLLRKASGKVLISIDNIIILFFGLVFGVLFPFDYIYSTHYPNSRDYLTIISNYSPGECLVYYALITLFLFVFIYVLRRTMKNKKMSKEASSGSKRFVQATYIVFFIGVASEFLYLRAYGGYLNYLNYSAFIRSGTNDFYNPFSFLIVFRNCIILSSIFFFSMIKKTNKKISFLSLFFFIASFSYSLLIFYSNKGRLSFVLYILIFPIFLIGKYKQNKYIDLKTILSFGIVGVAFLGLIVFLGNIMSRNSTTGFVDTLAEESSFVFANFKTILNNEPNYRLFVDIILYPIFVLPSSIWRGIMPNTASDVMTILISGSKKGTNGVYGESPIDLISLSYIQLNVVGVLVCSVVFALFAAWIFRKIKIIKNENINLMITIYVTINLIIRSVFYGDSYNIVQRAFPLIVFAIVYWAIGPFHKKNNYKVRSCRNEIVDLHSKS